MLVEHGKVIGVLWYGRLHQNARSCLFRDIPSCVLIRAVYLVGCHGRCAEEMRQEDFWRVGEGAQSWQDVIRIKGLVLAHGVNTLPSGRET